MRKALKSKNIEKRSILLIIITMIVITGFIPIYILEASDYDRGEYLKGWGIKKGDSFSVEYIHSVQLTPVIEVYTVDVKGKIVLKESYFNSYGAGLPSTTPYKFETTQNRFRIYDINKEMDNLIYRTGAVISNHQININGSIYPFLDFSKPRSSVKLKVNRLLLLEYIFKEVYHAR